MCCGVRGGLRFCGRKLWSVAGFSCAECCLVEFLKPSSVQVHHVELVFEVFGDA